MKANTFSTKMEYPQWVVIQLMEHCNLRCSMCYEWGENGSYPGKKELASLDFKVLEKTILELRPARPFFGLFGGEPFLYRQIGDVIRLIKEGGSKVDIPTNGMLIAKKAEMLVETQPNRLWISLDGPEEINDRQRGQGVFRSVMEGIDRLHKVREAKNSRYPKIGVTFIVTPLTYPYIEEFFLNCLDLSRIEHLSIEFQTYITEEKHRDYTKVLQRDFGIEKAPIAAGSIQYPADFAAMDYASIVRQINKVREVCDQRGIYFVAYPKTTEQNNVRNYFTANWKEMTDKRAMCLFPWVYTEIAATGEVSVCHTFYDMPLGNINEHSLLDIRRGEPIQQARNYLRKNGLFPICTGCARYYADPSKH
uniref:4Fe-4S single cluster domain-containing protein n=1 Tax=Candidatus Kentrum sp. UNK TaxID=2126344 RepID=A0A451AXP9_9GAMM|nr:MAG: 4Fe-4S single cluster domain-containing protein [Candidatus Kentron sp. UNK]VFK70829.1 MAG: 4Fe-4S single cluster domain-containing protein [Candidatus Kentron sp. UNK]